MALGARLGASKLATQLTVVQNRLKYRLYTVARTQVPLAISASTSYVSMPQLLRQGTGSSAELPARRLLATQF